MWARFDKGFISGRTTVIRLEYDFRSVSDSAMTQSLTTRKGEWLFTQI